MWEIILTEEVEQWYLALDSDAMNAVTGAINYLEQNGPMARRPVVGEIQGSKYHHMKELIPPGVNIRVLFLFDPQRNAVLLVAGDKTGQWKQWYTDNIPIAEERYENWLQTNGGE
ncbi:MAG: type II toxin-antitoxin system RelE/ParE family toxin [Microthrixaceae bacterium]|nr:type II toxin-antitoxin system RelE/ParE family toxin [Microthrixaceae bacterium]